MVSCLWLSMRRTARKFLAVFNWLVAVTFLVGVVWCIGASPSENTKDSLIPIISSAGAFFCASGSCVQLLAGVVTWRGSRGAAVLQIGAFLWIALPVAITYA